MKKNMTMGKVLSQREIAPDIYDLLIQTDLAGGAHSGQFVGVYPEDKSLLLPRPISICEVLPGEGALRLVYRIAGKGTKEFSSYKEGDSVRLLGNLGNGFPAAEAVGKTVFLMGGGIGIPPMLNLAKEIDSLAKEKGKESETKIIAILGYRDSKLFLKEDLEKYATVYVATEDGSVGTKGNVLTAVSENNLSADLIMACGPMPMLRAIKAYAADKAIAAYISLEERMACGVGACLGCVCKTRDVDHHSKVKNARICTDGPVFLAEEVEI